jgi:hypothetical protein
MERDRSKELVRAEAEACKSSVKLDGSGQSPKFSGHESAPYGSGGPSAAGPSSHAPGK